MTDQTPPEDRQLVRLRARTRDSLVVAHLGPCAVWTAGTNEYGYGRTSVNGRDMYAHRLAWLLQVGPIPIGLYVLHRCDNPPCVQLSHLFLGTQQDNINDMKAKGRQALGLANGAGKLSEDEVAQIRIACSRGEPQRAVAARFGISQAHVGDISRGRYRTAALLQGAGA